jgi:hypothetical protein
MVLCTYVLCSVFQVFDFIDEFILHFVNVYCKQ